MNEKLTKEQIEKVVKAEGFDFKVLRGALKAFNDAEVLEKPVKMVGKKKEQLVRALVEGVEFVEEGSEEEKKIPGAVIELYNVYADVIEDKAVDLTDGSEEEKPSEEVEQKEENIEEKPKPKPKYTRSHALVESLKKGGTKSKLIEMANDLYVKSGGSDKPQVAKALLHYVLPSLLLFGVVKEENGVFKSTNE